MPTPRTTVGGAALLVGVAALCLMIAPDAPPRPGSDSAPPALERSSAVIIGFSRIIPAGFSRHQPVHIHLELSGDTQSWADEIRGLHDLGK